MAAVKIYFDGAYYASTQDMFSLVVFAQKPFLYSTGSNGRSSTHAEWLSAITALEFAADRNLTDFVLVGDSENVIEAMRGNREARGINADLKKYALGLCQEIGQVDWKWISSAKNPAGIILRELGDLR